MTLHNRNGSDTRSSGSASRKKNPTEEIEMIPTQSIETGPSGAFKLDEANSVEKTGYMFSTKKKWQILTVVALCQTSMSKSMNPFL
jgi:hypothetical protein